MDLKALFLNCTLKPSPNVSNTEALLKRVEAILSSLDVQCEIIRVVDYKIAFGVSSDEGKGMNGLLFCKRLKPVIF